jgi:catechol-2,3-dioxygenase
MPQVPIRSLGRLILCLAGYASCIFVGPIAVFGEDTKSQAPPPPKIDHILLEVSNLAVSIRFYRDFLGLHLKSRTFGFAMLESGNVGLFLWSRHWNWEEPRSSPVQLPRLMIRRSVTEEQVFHEGLAVNFCGE